MRPAQGAVLGTAQGIVLRAELRGYRVRPFAVATAAAGAVAWAAGMSLGGYGSALPPAALVLAVGLLGPTILLSIGVAQWAVLRRFVAHAGWWIPATALAWLLGTAVVFAAMASVPEDASAWRIALTGIPAGLAMGIVSGTVSGLALVALLRGTTSAPAGRSAGAELRATTRTRLRSGRRAHVQRVAPTGELRPSRGHHSPRSG